MWVLGKGYQGCQKPQEWRAWNEESQQYNGKGLQVVPHPLLRCSGSGLVDSCSIEALTLLSCFRITHHVYTDRQENRRIEPSRYGSRDRAFQLQSPLYTIVIFQRNLFSLSFLCYEENQTKIPTFLNANQNEENSTYYNRIPKTLD